MTSILSVVAIYVFTLFASFLLIRMIAWGYKLKAKNEIIRYFFRLAVFLCFYISMMLMLLANKFLGLEVDYVLHSLICMFVYVAALIYAIAKYDPHAHDKVEFKFKKRK